MPLLFGDHFRIIKQRLQELAKESQRISGLQKLGAAHPRLDGTNVYLLIHCHPLDCKGYRLTGEVRRLLFSTIVSRTNSDISSSPELQHLPYLETLPPAQLLTTPLTFNDEELDLLKGTNLYGATTDRKRDIIEQHSRCQAALTTFAPNLADHFTLWVTRLLVELVLTNDMLNQRALPDSCHLYIISLLPFHSAQPKPFAHVECRGSFSAGLVAASRLS